MLLVIRKFGHSLLRPFLCCPTVIALQIRRLSPFQSFVSLFFQLLGRGYRYLVPPFGATRLFQVSLSCSATQQLATTPFLAYSIRFFPFLVVVPFWATTPRGSRSSFHDAPP